MTSVVYLCLSVRIWLDLPLLGRQRGPGTWTDAMHVACKRFEKSMSPMHYVKRVVPFKRYLLLVLIKRKTRVPILLQAIIPSGTFKALSYQPWSLDENVICSASCGAQGWSRLKIALGSNNKSI